MRINGHRKRLAYMSQPAEGWYADCSCGELRGALRGTKETGKALAQADFDKHLEEVAQRLQLA